MVLQSASQGKNDLPLPPGKLPPDLLSRLFAALPTVDAQLVLGPSLGEDAAVIDFAADNGDAKLLVAKSDPITFATDEIGHYVVNVCANDLAVTGAAPRFFLPTVLLPADSATVKMATSIFQQIGDACRSLQIVVAGGHTEITHAVSQPIVAGSMLGEVQRQHLVRSSGCRVGDAVLLAGSVPIEGASIIAREKRDELLADGWCADEVSEAANYLFSPGISVLKPALAAARDGLVTAMHDPTEGGVISGLAELATAADVGLVVDLDAISLSPLARRLCARYDLHPLGTIASGALLATCPAANVETLLQLWQGLDWPAAIIGQIRPAANGLTATTGGQPSPFPTYAVDEITKLFS